MLTTPSRLVKRKSLSFVRLGFGGGDSPGLVSLIAVAAVENELSHLRCCIFSRPDKSAVVAAS